MKMKHIVLIGPLVAIQVAFGAELPNTNLAHLVRMYGPADDASNRFGFIWTNAPVLDRRVGIARFHWELSTNWSSERLSTTTGKDTGLVYSNLHITVTYKSHYSNSVCLETNHVATIKRWWKMDFSQVDNSTHTFAKEQDEPVIEWHPTVKAPPMPPMPWGWQLPSTQRRGEHRD